MSENHQTYTVLLTLGQVLFKLYIPSQNGYVVQNSYQNDCKFDSLNNCCIYEFNYYFRYINPFLNKKIVVFVQSDLPNVTPFTHSKFPLMSLINDTFYNVLDAENNYIFRSINDNDNFVVINFIMGYFILDLSNEKNLVNTPHNDTMIFNLNVYKQSTCIVNNSVIVPENNEYSNGIQCNGVGYLYEKFSFNSDRNYYIDKISRFENKYITDELKNSWLGLRLLSTIDSQNMCLHINKNFLTFGNVNDKYYFDANTRYSIINFLNGECSFLLDYHILEGNYNPVIVNWIKTNFSGLIDLKKNDVIEDDYLIYQVKLRNQELVIQDIIKDENLICQTRIKYHEQIFETKNQNEELISQIRIGNEPIKYQLMIQDENIISKVVNNIYQTMKYNPEFMIEKIALNYEGYIKYESNYQDMIEESEIISENEMKNISRYIPFDVCIKKELKYLYKYEEKEGLKSVKKEIIIHFLNWTKAVVRDLNGNHLTYLYFHHNTEEYVCYNSLNTYLFDYIGVKLDQNEIKSVKYLFDDISIDSIHLRKEDMHPHVIHNSSVDYAFTELL